MKTNPRRTVVVLLVSAAIGLAGAGLLDRVQHGGDETRAALNSGGANFAALDPKDMALFEAVALESCRCEARSGDAGCWQGYDASTAKFDPASFGTACAPIASEGDCFATSQGEICVTKVYRVVTGGSGGSSPIVCTRQDARAIEAAWSSATATDQDVEQRLPDTDGRAVMAVNEVLDRIQRGEVLEAAPAEQGCI